MIAFDVPTALLIVGVVALCVTTAISSLALPTVALRRRRRRRVRPLELPAGSSWRVVTGSPAALPPLTSSTQVLQLVQAWDRPHERYDAPSQRPAPDMDDVETFIEHLLEHHPERLADIMTRWINADAPPVRPDTMKRA